MEVKIFNEVKKMAEEAANFVSEKIKDAIQEKGNANILLATAGSQLLFLKAIQNKGIDWQKTTIFHLDEYKGISEQHVASFRKILKENILNKINPGAFYLIQGDARNCEKEIARYEKLFKAHPIDVACIGIGENGHIAFNDPHVADFNDPKTLKVVELDETCRQQQVGEGWFPSFADVPQEAFTLTIPAILQSKSISCVVPGSQKADAVYKTIHGEISTSCPASILRTHPDTILFLDAGSASKSNVY